MSLDAPVGGVAIITADGEILAVAGELEGPFGGRAVLALDADIGAGAAGGQLLGIGFRKRGGCGQGELLEGDGRGTVGDNGAAIGNRRAVEAAVNADDEVSGSKDLGGGAARGGEEHDGRQDEAEMLEFHGK